MLSPLYWVARSMHGVGHYISEKCSSCVTQTSYPPNSDSPFPRLFPSQRPAEAETCRPSVSSQTIFILKDITEKRLGLSYLVIHVWLAARCRLRSYSPSGAMSRKATGQRTSLNNESEFVCRRLKTSALGKGGNPTTGKVYKVVSVQ